jgi:hypothetical protein
MPARSFDSGSAACPGNTTVSLAFAQDDGFREERFLQKSGFVRATKPNFAHRTFFCLLSLFLAIAPLALAQTNAPDASSAPTTNAPADVDPAPAMPTLNLPANPSQAGPPQPDPGLNDIRPPVFFLHSWFWLWITLATLAAIALLIFLWYRFRPNRLLSPKSAYELALEKLEKARALLLEDNPMPYAVFVSETIRSYLGQRFQAPSTRRTTEEFLRLMEADRNTPLAEHRELLRTFLQSCDLVKFARYQPTLSELEQVQDRATSFVTATKPLPSSSQRNGARSS